jgi:hypothetical protein
LREGLQVKTMKLQRVWILIKQVEEAAYKFLLRAKRECYQSEMRKK